jgi:uncharacterized protein YidB (DUF937 family)
MIVEKGRDDMAENPRGAAATSAWTKQLNDTLGGEYGAVIERIRNSPLSAQLRSWIGPGENEPVTAGQITEVLGPRELAKIAGQTGVSPEQAAHAIAHNLPGLINRMTVGTAHGASIGESGIEALMRDALGKPLGGGAGPPM